MWWWWCGKCCASTPPANHFPITSPRPELLLLWLMLKELPGSNLSALILHTPASAATTSSSTGSVRLAFSNLTIFLMRGDYYFLGSSKANQRRLSQKECKQRAENRCTHSMLHRPGVNLPQRNPGTRARLTEHQLTRSVWGSVCGGVQELHFHLIVFL